MYRMASMGLLGAALFQVLLVGCQQSKSISKSEPSTRSNSESGTSPSPADLSLPPPYQPTQAVPETVAGVAADAEVKPERPFAAAEPSPASDGGSSDTIPDSNAPPESSAIPESSAPQNSSVTVSSASPASNGVQATEEERNQIIAADWPTPQLVLYVSGQQLGYIEPCGCTGLDTQKGGLIRRDTLLTSLRDRGWEVLPIDVGNQVRRAGQQPLIKFDTTAQAMQQMGYQAVALGVHDLRLSKVDLIQIAGSEESSPRPYICANVVVLLPDFFPAYKIMEAGGRKIGVTAILGSEFEIEVKGDEVEFIDPAESLKRVVPELQSKGCDFIVLLAHTSLEESAKIAKEVDGIDLVVTAGGYGEPTLHPEPIPESQAVMVQVGVKGMYGGIIGLYDDPQQPIRYQKLAISSQFKDSERMLELFSQYQKRLQESGFNGLGLFPASHPTGRKFVGSESCADCHTTAYDIWKDSPHVHATDSIVAANNDRGGIARHFDPECISCHVTGWNPQEFSPFDSGYLDLQQSEHLLGSGCENCHGPGSEHVAAENGDIEASAELLKQLREEMILPLDRAEQKCLECHDLDNSPDFHDPGAFEEYWEQVKHYGKD
jgi:calcineurin-like phosphoesterase